MAAPRGSVALSGASSFTGLCIARELHGQGWSTHALYSSARETYVGLRAARLAALDGRAELAFGIRAEDGGMEAWIRRHRPEIWVHHHHWMEEFRSPSYDRARSDQVGLAPLAG